jgi:hypothetical protein
VLESWWPFRRRNETTAAVSTPDAAGERRLDETKRILRRVAHEAVQAATPPDQAPAPAPVERRQSDPTVTVYGDIVHVNFHQSGPATYVVVRKDPITRKLTPIARRFERTDVFYAKDGRLLGGDEWIG